MHHCSSPRQHSPECEFYAAGGDVEANQRFAADPAIAVDHAIFEKGLHHALAKAGHSRAKHQGAEFLEHAKSGQKALDRHAADIFNPDAEATEENPQDTGALAKHVDELRMNPAAAESVGGELGDAFPDHHLQLVGKLSAAMGHLDKIRPFSGQGGPLDGVVPPSKKELSDYRRQLSIAQNPALVYQRAKNATLQPADVETLKSIYPKLYQEMLAKAGDALADHVSRGHKLTKQARRGLGVLMGQNLSFVQTPLAMQAIMRANAVERPQAAPGKPAERARNKAVDESNKQAQIEATDDQARQFKKV